MIQASFIQVQVPPLSRSIQESNWPGWLSISKLKRQNCN